MKWWICLTALVLALTTSAAAADLPAELERAAPEAAEELLEGDRWLDALWLREGYLVVGPF